MSSASLIYSTKNFKPITVHNIGLNTATSIHVQWLHQANYLSKITRSINKQPEWFSIEKIKGRLHNIKFLN